MYGVVDLWFLCWKKRLFVCELTCSLRLYLISLYLIHFVMQFRPESSNLNNLTNSDAAVWIKITSSWLGLLVYIWTLIAPVFFPDRDFD